MFIEKRREEKDTYNHIDDASNGLDLVGSGINCCGEVLSVILVCGQE